MSSISTDQLQFPPRPQSYSYDQLSGESAFRLLELKPGRDDDPVICNLRKDDIAAKPSYDALSYVWGDATLNQEVICNGDVLKITTSLRNALRRLRQQTDKITIWADAICINQDNLDERAQQVKIMGSIYKSAVTVRIWLGEDNGKAVDAFSYIRHAFENMDTETQSPSYIPDAVWDLFCQPWFFRVWVIQEAGFAANSIAMWGDEEIDFTKLGFVAQWLSNLVPFDMLSMPFTGLKHAAFIGRTFSLHHSALYSRFGEVGSPNILLSRGQLEQLHGGPAFFLQILKDARSFSATDPRDKIFALLGHPSAQLAGETSNGLMVEVDYRRSPEDICREFVQRFIELTKSLDILSLVHHPTSQDESTNEIPSDMPTWIPRLYDYYSFDCLPGSNYSADLHAVDCPPYIISADKLYVYGFICGLVGMFSRCFRGLDFHLEQDEPNTKDPVFHILETFAPNSYVPDLGPRPPYNSIASAIGLTLTAGRVPLYVSDQARDEIAQEKGLAIDKVFGNLESMEAARIRQHQMNFLSYQSRVLESHGVQTARTQQYCNAPGAYPSQFERLATEACHGRRYFMSAEKYIGLGPEVLAKGDLVCVIIGAKTPFLLRPRGDTYQVVGECYLYGFMEGQAIEMAAKASLRPQQFILV